MKILPLILSILLPLVCGKEPPAPHNDGMSAVEALEYCTPWGKIQIAIKNKNGSFSNVDIAPHDLICEISPNFCILENGKLVMDPQYPVRLKMANSQKIRPCGKFMLIWYFYSDFVLHGCRPGSQNIQLKFHHNPSNPDNNWQLFAPYVDFQGPGGRPNILVAAY